MKNLKVDLSGNPLLAFEKCPADNRNRGMRRQHCGPPAPKKGHLLIRLQGIACLAFQERRLAAL
jgi:hypothetical protein